MLPRLVNQQQRWRCAKANHTTALYDGSQRKPNTELLPLPLVAISLMREHLLKGGKECRKGQTSLCKPVDNLRCQVTEQLYLPSAECNALADSSKTLERLTPPSKWPRKS